MTVTCYRKMYQSRFNQALQNRLRRNPDISEIERLLQPLDYQWGLIDPENHFFLDDSFTFVIGWS